MAKLVDILLVDDDREDAVFLQQSFLEYLQVRHRLSIVPDGDTALAFLQRQAPHAEAPRPDLIILDIHIPKTNGWEVLTVIRATPSLTKIPVAMLTGILSPFDEAQRDTLRPALCLLKPTTLEESQSLVKAIEAYLIK